MYDFLLTGQSFDWTGFFNWSVIHSHPGVTTWTQSPFDITPVTLPIALLDSICSNYIFLPDSVTEDQHNDFSQSIIRSLLDTDEKYDGISLTLYSISENFLKSTTISGSPGLHGALVRSIERSLKECLERTEIPCKKKRKDAGN